MAKTLHICPDEKFMDMIYDKFETINPGNNRVIVISNTKKFKHIKKTPAYNVSPLTLLGRRFAESLAAYDVVFIHYMNQMDLFLISQTPKNVRFVWCGWGVDYYDLITQGDRTALLKPRTKELFCRQMELRKSTPLVKMKQFIKGLFGYDKMNKIEIINNRVSYFVPVIEEDYELVKKSIPEFRPSYISWNNGTLEDDMIRDFKDEVVSGRNILLGNSASYENNHLDAFDLIKKQKLDGRKIIAPLSYGDAFYREKIITYGKQYFGEGFFPLVDFLPIDQYLDIIKSCSYVLMNHLRQQGLGSIISMLYMGAKVFLDKKNPVYHFFKKQGAHIFTLDDFDSELRSKLKMPEIEKNRDILRKRWSRDVILNKTKNMIDTVMSSPGM